MADKKTLTEALAFLLEGDGMIDRLEADALLDVILSDGKVTDEEKAFLEETLRSANFDEVGRDKIERFLASYGARA
jgi:hypothetical protein